LRACRRAGDSIPVVIVTGYPSLATAIKAVDLRVGAYLVKPVDFEDLLERVRLALAGGAPFLPRARDRLTTRVSRPAGPRRPGSHHEGSTNRETRAASVAGRPPPQRAVSSARSRTIALRVQLRHARFRDPIAAANLAHRQSLP